MGKILTLLLACGFALPVKADVITMYGKETFGFNQPKYSENYDREIGKQLNLHALAEFDDFPVSSKEQGSVFNKIFLDLYEQLNIRVFMVYNQTRYPEIVASFERGELSVVKEINARFGVYYEEYRYSKNGFIYPSFFENEIYVLSSKYKNLQAKNKEDLKNYRGVYVKSDRLPKIVLRDFSKLKMTSVETFPEAYEELLSGKADYIAASYYKSLIEIYKLGIRNYIAYSSVPVWKAPMFLRVASDLKNHPQITGLKEYLKSERYKTIRDNAFNELIEIYKENTKGVIPPTYVAVPTEENETKENN